MAVFLPCLSKRSHSNTLLVFLVAGDDSGEVAGWSGLLIDSALLGLGEDSVTKGFVGLLELRGLFGGGDSIST